MIRRQQDIDDDGVIVRENAFNITYFDNSKGYLFRARSYNVKSYNDIRLSEIVRNNDDFCKVHLLAEYIYKDTNCIAVRVNSRRVRMADIEDISKILDISIRRAKDFITRMKKLHVIAVRLDMIGDTITSKYVFNPLFFNSSKYLSAELYFLFQESLDKHLKPWVIKRFHEFGNIKNDK